MHSSFGAGFIGMAIIAAGVAGIIWALRRGALALGFCVGSGKPEGASPFDTFQDRVDKRRQREISKELMKDRLTGAVGYSVLGVWRCDED